MADLINRTAAKNAIRKELHADMDMLTGMIAEGICKVLDELPSAQQWIPVSPETMPESGKNVLLTCWNGEDVCDGWVDANGCWHIACEEVAEGYEPLAWQRLPEPWKGEQP